MLKTYLLPSATILWDTLCFSQQQIKVIVVDD
jgi:hypothetical protein